MGPHFRGDDGKLSHYLNNRVITALSTSRRKGPSRQLSKKCPPVKPKPIRRSRKVGGSGGGNTGDRPRRSRKKKTEHHGPMQ